MEATLDTWTLLLTAMAAGFFGSVHCLGMCGGVSGTIALSARNANGRASAGLSAIPVSVVAISRAGTLSASATSTNVLAFNVGRILSYAIAGATAGSAGAMLGKFWLVGDSLSVRTTLFLIANTMIVLTGLYLMGLPQLLAPLERAGGHLWKHLSPLTRKILPIDTASRALAFGMLWGWIPCGLVYAMLLGAISAGSPVAGALTMMAFGIGTLPAMILAGLTAGQLRRWTRDARVRLAAGGVVVALGLLGFIRAGEFSSLKTFGALCTSLMQGTP